MKKRRGKQHIPSLLAPLSDEEFVNLMRDDVSRYERSVVALRWCSYCNDWEPYGSRDAGLCLRCFRHHVDGDGSR